MRAIAEVPGSTWELHSVRKLTQQYHHHQNEQKRTTKQVSISVAKWSKFGRLYPLTYKEIRVLYRAVPEVIRLISKANAAVMCPGYPSTKLVGGCGCGAHSLACMQHQQRAGGAAHIRK